MGGGVECRSHLQRLKRRSEGEPQASRACFFWRSGPGRCAHRPRTYLRQTIAWVSVATRAEGIDGCWAIKSIRSKPLARSACFSFCPLKDEGPPMVVYVRGGNSDSGVLSSCAETWIS